METYSQQKIHPMKRTRRTKADLTSISSDSSQSSASSVIFSMCPILINENHSLFTNDDQSNENNSEYKKLKSSNSVRITPTDRKLTRSHSLDLKTKCKKDDHVLTDNESLGVPQNNNKKKLYHQSFRRLLRLQQESQSSTDSSVISSDSCLNRLLLRPRLSDENYPSDIRKCQSEPPSPPPPPPPPPPICVQLSPERLNHLKQRQAELDRSVSRLIESVTIKANENINQISKYWSHIKEISLDKHQSKSNNFQLFGYVLKSTYVNKQMEIFFEENDEIKAALQVLSTTLLIVQDHQSYSTINQLFDNEERLMIANLRCQLECLLSSYRDELSFIREGLNYYQSNLNEEKQFRWTQIIQIDYPCLIERISNDFVIKIPQLEQILLQMLRNMKKHLLNIPIEINKT